jgi:predicted DCC family thiol-disulfide oxidoreductase YuxK
MGSYIDMKVEQPLLLFDGHCNLCSRSVQFVLENERTTSNIHFASLQSETGVAVKDQLGPDAPDSLIFVHHDKIYSESTGFLVLCQYLKFPWSALQVFRIVPSFLRDPIYRWVARNRYQWMGKRETCWMPQPKWKSRFIH